MFGHSSKINAHINISRPHKDRMELPHGEIPLQIILKCSNEKDNLFIEQIGNELNLFLQIPVYFGTITTIEKIQAQDEYQFNVKKEFSKINLSGLIKQK